MEKMTSYLSDKLKMLSFISIIMVVYIHTCYAEGDKYTILSVVEDLVSDSIARIAVPLFYLISGYLLFLHLDSLASCWRKMRKRMRTLLVPYLMANVLTLAFHASFDALGRLIPNVGGGNEHTCFRMV